MSITDTQNNFGAWSLKLRSQPSRDDRGHLLPAAPQEILDLFAVTDGPDAFLGHVIFTSQAFNLGEVDVLELSRYTGVLRESKFSTADVEIAGSGLIYWLGDLQERGPIFDTELNLTNESFVDGITAILPPAITAGNIVAEIGTASASYLFVTARAALEDWLSLFGAEYYVDPQGRLNAGTAPSLFPSYNAPTTFVIRKGTGDDPNFKPLPLGSATFSGDMTNFATKVISLVQVEETNFIEGSAEGSTSKRDLHGNLVEITAINNESSTLAENVDARAAARLAQLQNPRTSLELSTENYDIHGDFKPGDSIWVYDVAAGLYDLNNEITFRGQTYWPMKLRVLEITYPITKGMGVYFRAPDANGTLYDLTPYVDWEPPGTSQIVVSEFSRSLIPPSSGGIGGVIAPVINPDSPPPIPDPPTIFGEERSLLVRQPTTSGGTALPLSVTKFDVYASTVSGFTPGPSNYIGYISVNRGDINLGIDVVKNLRWEEDEQTYVRTAAVNSAGPGPATAEVAVTAGLIPSAAILDLTADKITAGTITASITIMSPHIVGGILETAVSGQRVAMEEGDFDRIKFYTGIATEIEPPYIASSSADGNLGLHGPEFSDSAEDTADINLISAGGPSAFPTSIAAISALDIRLLTPSQAGTIFIGGGLELFDAAANRLEVDGTHFFSNFEAGYISGDSNAIDLSHDLGGRIFIDNLIEMIAGAAVRMEVRSDRINLLIGTALNGHPLYYGTAGTVDRIETIGGHPGIIGTSTVKLLGNTQDVMLRVGIGGEVDVVAGNETGGYRTLTAIINDVSDPKFKEKTGDAPVNDLVNAVSKAANGLFLGRFKHEAQSEESTESLLMLDADLLPAGVRRNLALGKGYSNSAMHAWHILNLEAIRKRLDALENPGKVR